MDYINIIEVLPEEVSHKISTLIWDALDKQKIITSDDAELSIRVYDDDIIDHVVSEGYLDSLSEGKDQPDDYSSKVDALVDSMGVTDKKVSTTHTRKDLDLL